MTTPNRHFYHYTNVKHAKEILGITRAEDSAWGEGLRPIRRLVGGFKYNLPERAYEGTSHGLLAPMPRNWVSERYEASNSILEGIIRDIGGDEIILLEVGVSDDDDVCIADSSVFLKEEFTKTVSEGRSEAETQDIMHRYFNSLCPWNQYFSEGRGYHLPEVVCFSTIPKAQIKPIRKVDFYDLLNEFRAETGFELLDKPPPPKEIDIDALLKRRLPNSKPA